LRNRNKRHSRTHCGLKFTHRSIQIGYRIIHIFSVGRWGARTAGGATPSGRNDGMAATLASRSQAALVSSFLRTGGEGGRGNSRADRRGRRSRRSCGRQHTSQGELAGCEGNLARELGKSAGNFGGGRGAWRARGKRARDRRRDEKRRQR
jgi:hypothetical protein